MIKPGEIYRLVDDDDFTKTRIIHRLTETSMDNTSFPCCAYAKTDDEIMVLELIENVPSFSTHMDAVRIMILNRDVPTIGWIRVNRHFCPPDSWHRINE